MTDLTLTGQRKVAIWVNVCYIGNLLLLPGLFFILIIYLRIKYAKKQCVLLNAHLSMSVKTSISAGIILLGLPLVLLINPNDPGLWVVVIVMWTCFHGAFVLWGIYSLSRALSYKPPLSPIPSE